MSDLLVLLTNDDGVDSPGILALEDAFSKCPGVEVWTVAPSGQRSTCSHGMTLHGPVFAKKLRRRTFSLSGLTADCVYFAMFHLLPRPPVVVVSGINKGANLGTDVVYSGTVAGAREAVVRGVHGVSASLVSGNEFSKVAPAVVRAALEVAAMPKDDPQLMNLNFPGGSFSGPVFAPLGKRIYPHVVEKRTAPLTGEDYFWLGGPPVKDEQLEGTDGHLIARGIASATFLSVDQTDTRELPEMDSVSISVEEDA